MQLGEADADAYSGDVDVHSSQDPSVGNGIVAESNAVATASIDQSAEQSNENEASLSLPTPTVDGAETVNHLQFAEQEEGVLQANVNIQSGDSEEEGVEGALSSAEAYSGDVSVTKDQNLTAGLDGITAQSNAVATAELDQSVTQTNEDC